MSQNTSVESSTRSPLKPSINPALQAALGSLDVQLEEELARYRRQRSGRPVMSARSLKRPSTRKPLDLITVEPVGEPTQSPMLRIMPPTLTNPLNTVSPKPIPQTNSPQEIEREKIDQMVPPEAPSSVASESAQTRVAPSPREETVTEPLTLSEQPEDRGGDLVPSATDQTQPDDYLESSEKLLRSLEEQETATHSKKRFTDRLLTPLGVGSMLLLLFSSATLTYIVLNPSTRSSLGFPGLFDTTPPTTAQNSTGTNTPNTNFGNDLPVKGPNLAADEFPEVNLDTLSRLGTSPNPSSIPAPIAPVPNIQPPQGMAPVAPPIAPPPPLPGRGSGLSSAILPPSLQPGAVPPTIPSPEAPASPPAAAKPPASTATAEPTQPKQSPTPTKPSPTPSPEASPSPRQTATVPGGFYYVVTNYNGEQSLQQARAIVPDAYVENFPQGARIQMGAFKLESEAKTLVEQLQQQGISASVYRP